MMEEDYEGFESPEEVLERRQNDLGFRPQSEIIFNGVLPYGNLLDEESNDWLNNLKEVLGISIGEREVSGGISAWIKSMSKYVKLYGLKFSKEDHVGFIKVLYGFVTESKVYYGVLNQGISLLSTLTWRKELISPMDLELPWRPLYDLYHSLFFTSDSRHYMFQLPYSINNSLRVLIRYCRPYFPLSATKEILETFKPLMCPLDASMERAFDIFQLFLPTYNLMEHKEKTYLLWFDDLLSYFKIFNSSYLQGYVFMLYSRLAEENVGLIDWNPVLPILFSKIQRLFQLPIGFKNVHVENRTYPYAGNQMQITTRWIVGTMGGLESQTQEYLSRMFKSLESYFQPANVGSYSSKLIEFVSKLCQNFVRRLHQERHAPLRRRRNITPEHKKLTEENITEFVESIKPLLKVSMYSRAGMSEKETIFSILATLRPQLIIPIVMDRVNSAFEALTEPHKLKASIDAVNSVARILVSSRDAYPQGPTYAIQLLISTLSGLDPNDSHKSVSTLQLISTLSTLIPIVDCNKGGSFGNITPEEDIILSQTASFEDFVVRLLDRFFAIIECSAYEQTREFAAASLEHQHSREETMKDTWVEAAFKSVMTQASSEIFDLALKKLESYLRGRILEHKVAGKLAARLCRAVTRVNPEKGLKAFLPNAINTIKALFANQDGIKNEENINNELMFNLLIIFEIISHTGSHLLSYADELEEILDLTLHLANHESHSLACSILKKVLSALTSVYPKEFRLIPEGYDSPQERFYIRDWGCPGDIHDLKIDWHEPSNKELEYASRMVDKFLGSELKALEDYAEKGVSLPRGEVKKRLNVVLKAIVGGAYVFPLWDHEEDLKLSSPFRGPSLLKKSIIIQSRKIEVKLFGQNVRWRVVQVLDKLQSRLLFDEDDTKSLRSVIGTYFYILHNFGVTKEEYNTHYSTSSVNCVCVGNRLIGRKHHIRAILIDKAFLQHQSRMVESLHMRFTDTHLKIINNLVKLATSHYGNVRITAQDVLIKTINSSHHSYKMVVPSLLEYLKDGPMINEEQLKGALYIILGSKNQSIVAKNDIIIQEQLWPSLIDSPSGKKPSIVSIMDNGITQEIREMVSFTIKLNLPDSIINLTKSFLASKCKFPSEDDIVLAEERLENINKKNEEAFYRTIDNITERLLIENLHWRRYRLSYTMLIRLIRNDFHIPPRTVRIFVQDLIHEDVDIRSGAVYAVTRILRQQKRPHVKIPCDLPDLPSNIIPGDRPDNEWLCYDELKLPNSEEEWEKPHYVHKTHFGYNTWPTDMEIYAPTSQQPKLTRSREELTDAEREIYDFFMDASKMDKLIQFLSVEANKGSDSFSAERFSLFKGLFRNFGDCFLALLKPHLERLVNDNSENFQRCACEIIAGIIRGAKHWSYSMTNNMYSWMVPLIRQALEKVSVESISNWGTCFATCSESRDPRRIHWMLNVLMEQPLRCRGSFIDSSRLYVLQGCLSQQEWRVGPVLHKLVNFLSPFLTHPFKNVRDRLGSVLMSIYSNDISSHVISYHRGPRLSDFIDSVIPQLQIISDETLPILTDSVEPVNSPVIGWSEERQVAMCLLQTVSKFVTCIVTRGNSEIRIDFFRLLPILCCNQSNYVEPDLAKDCVDTMAALSQALIPTRIVPEWLQIMEDVLNCGSWRAREALLEFLQVSVFCNFPALIVSESWTVQISEIVEASLKDQRVEVREKACGVLSGLIHSNFINDERKQKLLKFFYKRAKCSTKGGGENLIRRHSGILGLCAFVDATPYDVPEYLPDILMVLSDHLHDPRPIPTKIEKTLQDFKRTHQDNWADHKLKFSEDQLSVLTDILVSPSYYA